MAAIDLIVLILFAVGLFLLYRLGRQGARAAWEAREQRPSRLREARLRFSEKTIRCERPARLVGRVDQVYELPSGELCIVDTKHRRRARVYESDIAQLSTYATILRSQGHRVHPEGYIRQVWKGQVRYLTAKLLNDRQVLSLLTMREKHLTNPESAPKAVHPVLCKGCGQRERGRCDGVG